MRYLTSYGALWGLTERQYRRLLKDGAAGKEWNLDNYGKRLGDVVNVTDALPEDFGYLLKEMSINS